MDHVILLQALEWRIDHALRNDPNLSYCAHPRSRIHKKNEEAIDSMVLDDRNNNHIMLQSKLENRDLLLYSLSDALAS